MNFEDQLDHLMTKAQSVIAELINDHGTESIHMSARCLKIKDDDLMFNIEGLRYLTEVHDDKLLDNEGYHYSHCAIGTEQFMQVVDHLVETYGTPKNEDDKEIIIVLDGGIVQSTHHNVEGLVVSVLDYDTEEVTEEDGVRNISFPGQKPQQAYLYQGSINQYEPLTVKHLSAQLQ